MSENRNFYPCAFPQAPVFSPAFGNFYRNTFLTTPVLPNQSIPFNATGASVGGVTLTTPTDIQITQGGYYSITYTITANISEPIAPFKHIIVAIFLNSIEVPGLQTTFGIDIVDPNDQDCLQVHGEAIVFIPSNSIVQLRNRSDQNQALTLCDGPVIAAAINLIKLD
ncbi:exosporium leader peptide [Bacillus sp. BP-3]|uniref:exosporium leader peptide n=1 Tax=Bacillus sp. BP-3 TaxID=3022773 RepID=UPI00232DE8A9|nr:exosporium leader peptide [Bacillus sp. BP-3]MDC2867923.1 exosporium leader peptide [Bacillus sp. BP-3]